MQIYGANADGGCRRGTSTGTRGNYCLCSISFSAGDCCYKTKIGDPSLGSTQKTEGEKTIEGRWITILAD